jgi:hypothetical protein
MFLVLPKVDVLSAMIAAMVMMIVFMMFKFL